ncbi:hypothetical protein HDU91_001175 [Kappamyces sp. JEL0680]|nr:hypothetical protein HDU91_001175 [Kappamyces sp. JEL0680]
MASARNFRRGATTMQSVSSRSTISTPTTSASQMGTSSGSATKTSATAGSSASSLSTPLPTPTHDVCSVQGVGLNQPCGQTARCVVECAAGLYCVGGEHTEDGLGYCSRTTIPDCALPPLPGNYSCGLAHNGPNGTLCHLTCQSGVCEHASTVASHFGTCSFPSWDPCTSTSIPVAMARGYDSNHTGTVSLPLSLTSILAYDPEMQSNGDAYSALDYCPLAPILTAQTGQTIGYLAPPPDAKKTAKVAGVRFVMATPSCRPSGLLFGGSNMRNGSDVPFADGERISVPYSPRFTFGFHPVRQPNTLSFEKGSVLGWYIAAGSDVVVQDLVCTAVASFVQADLGYSPRDGTWRLESDPVYLPSQYGETITLSSPVAYDGASTPLELALRSLLIHTVTDRVVTADVYANYFDRAESSSTVWLGTHLEDVFDFSDKNEYLSILFQSRLRGGLCAAAQKPVVAEMKNATVCAV